MLYARLASATLASARLIPIVRMNTLGYVAAMIDEDAELLEVIVSNDDNLSYGNIISVYTGPDEAITPLTDHGVEELAEAAPKMTGQFLTLM